MKSAKLQIQQTLSNHHYHEFALIGTVDVDAAHALESIYLLPGAQTTAELNFAQVEWINSMGLALMLKLFEHWQQKNINIRITRTNQMVSLLFNKSGLANFLASSLPAQAHYSLNPITAADLPVLQIQPSHPTDCLEQQFSFIGTIDVNAISVLEPLYQMPEQSKVELNFAQVERINSMGLAQLLKLFEHWQKRNITIQVVNVNRMITVLFKMTGLSRFLSETHSPAKPNPPTTSFEKTSVITAPSSDIFNAKGLLYSPTPSTTALAQTFDFTGVIDVDATTVLESLYTLPEGCAVQLNFTGVQRVNSMGLAQLLKLFEHWQKNNIATRVVNANRMISVLFKMTGLNRFLTDQPLSDKPDLAVTTPKTLAASPTQLRTDTARQANNMSKLSLWISAQSSQQMNGWYFFNTYLQRQLGREIHMELVHGAMTERRKHIEDMDIIFTKPFEATRLMLEHQFTPLLRPIDQADEVTILVREDETRTRLSDFKNSKVVTAAPDSFVYLLGRFLLEESEPSLANIDYLFSGHDIKALQMLLKGSADILFMLSETYRGLSGLTRKNLRQIDQSETAFACHLFCTSPAQTDLGLKLSEILLDMSLDSQGRQVLADLGLNGWSKPNQDECDMLTMLYQRYAQTS